MPEDAILMPNVEPKPPGISTIAVIPPPSPAALIQSEQTVHIPKSKEIDKFHAQIRDMMKGMGNSNAECWDAVKSIDDINEILRTNIYQFQVRLQSQIEDCGKVRKTCIELMDSAEFKELAMEDPRAWSKLMNTYQTHLKIADNTVIELGRIVKEVAKEYREFALSRRSSVHVSQIEKFALAIKEVIQHEIHDAEVLRRISIHLTELFRKLFPSSLDDGI